MASPEPSPSPAVPRSRRLRHFLVRLGVLVASAAGALLLAELAVRLVGVHVPPRGDAGTQGIMRDVPPEDAPRVLYELRPGVAVETAYPGAPGEPPRVVTYRVNDQGFRGHVAVLPKPAGTYRVVALGDSFTYGTGVDEDETWPHLLEEHLRERVPDRPVEVLNWGVPAYNTQQEVGQLNQRVATYAPDLVVLCAYVNDASGEGRAGGGGGAAAARPWEVVWCERLGLTSGRWGDEAPKSPAQARTMALRERSRLADLLAWKLHGRLMARVTARNYAADWTPGSKGHDMVRGALAAAAVLSRREGFELIAVMYPDLASLGEPYGFAREHAAFAALCEATGVPFHDLTPVFAGRDPAALQAHAHDKHPNRAANALVAAHLAELLAPRVRER